MLGGLLSWKPLDIIIETQGKIMGTMYRVVQEKDTLDIWVNGTKVEMAGEFTDEGTETHFAIGSQPAFVRAVSSGKRREGIIHTLYVHDTEVPEYLE